MSCPRFVQNAWKRDLCSNCFKGKEDHAPVVDNRARYLASLKDISRLPPPPSILKGVVRKNLTAIKVHFPAEESQIIGYGGDEFSDQEEDDFNHVQENGKVEENPADEEEDRNFQKLTESNTEFNKDPANLCIDKPLASVKKTTTTPLKLGQNGTEGKKQPLLVSVQPFGSSPVNTTPLALSRKTHLNNLLHDAVDSIKLSDTSDVKPPTPSMTNQESQEENKTEPVCEKDNLFKNVKNMAHVNKIVVDSKPECIIENESKTETKNENVDEDSIKKTEKAEHRLSSLIEGKKSQITRGAVLTKSHEQVKTKKYFQLNNIKPEDDIPVSESILKKLESSDINSLGNSFSRAKDTISIKTNTHHKNVKNIANGLFSSKLLKKEFGIQPDLQLTKIKSIEYIDSNISAISKPVGITIDAKINGENDIPLVSFAKLPLEEISKKNEMLIIDGVPAESREMVGEPDGRADSDEMDDPPPDLPTTPPPLLTDHIPRPSFLHSLSKDKPKLPTKPKLRDKSPPKELVLDHPPLEPTLSDPSLSPSNRNSLNTKRQAPKPPPTPLGESPPKFTGTAPDDSPVGRRERASSCSPLPSDSSSSSSQTPEPVTRRSLSLSHETLTPPPLPAMDKKKGNKMRSTIRKFLRLASREDVRCDEGSGGPPPLPPPRPRPEIIHPLDLNKSAVQVLRSDGSLVTSNKDQNSGSDTPSSPTTSISPGFIGEKLDKENINSWFQYDSDLPAFEKKTDEIARSVLKGDADREEEGGAEEESEEGENTNSIKTPSHSPPLVYVKGRPNKPPPPPRSQSLDSALGVESRPVRPPPPNKDLLSTHKPSESPPATNTNNYSVYVNIGEVRSAIAPVKPQRTASLREKDNLEPIYQSTSALQTTESLYESLAPECDLSRERSSLPYCGSETESDIYCPYTFVNSQKGGEELRASKVRSVVHKNLEDNYGAVVVANYEALTQLLEQTTQRPVLPVPLRPLKTQSTLQWADFTVVGDGEEVGGRVFLPATWGSHPVTLSLAAGQARLPNCFVAITQFFDLVSSHYINHGKTDLVQVSVAVLARQEFLSLASVAAQLSGHSEAVRESALIMVQVVNSLKSLQAQGREEASLSQCVMAREDQQSTPRVCLLPHDADKGGETVSLCRCAMQASELLCLPQQLRSILQTVLGEERATSLTQAKAVLELWLWGPSHIPSSTDTQQSLQRWLDLERATVLHSLVVRRPLTLSCGDYCHLAFLVRTNAKIMADALTLLDQAQTAS